MSSLHIIYIPACIVAGIVVGWYIGSRAIRNEWDRAEKRRRIREEEA